MRTRANWRVIAVWMVSVLMAGLFAWSGVQALRADDMIAASFHEYGYSPGFMKFIGNCELAGAIGLLIPRLRSLAALGLLVIMGGAIVTHARFHEWSHIGLPIVLAVALATVMVAERPFRHIARPSRPSRLHPV
jgi:putative oxidoreductase